MISLNWRFRLATQPLCVTHASESTGKGGVTVVAGVIDSDS